MTPKEIKEDIGEVCKKHCWVDVEVRDAGQSSIFYVLCLNCGAIK
jgi:RNase P subunit RPR2